MHMACTPEHKPSTAAYSREAALVHEEAALEREYQRVHAGSAAVRLGEGLCSRQTHGQQTTRHQDGAQGSHGDWVATGAVWTAAGTLWTEA